MTRYMWNPYVGEGADGMRRSAQIDREEADTLDTGDPRRGELLARADEWERRAFEFDRHRCSCGEGFATAEELFNHVESHDTAKAKGACPVCASFVTIEVEPDETSYTEAASRHRPECAATFAERAKAAKAYLQRREAEGRPLDLWDP